MNTRTFYKTVLCILLLTFTILASSCDNEREAISPNENNQGSGDSVVTNEATGKINSVFIYTTNGISRYNYDTKGRITDILILDPITLTSDLVDPNSKTCKYSYDEYGNICEYIYFGKNFNIVEYGEDGKPIRAENNNGVQLTVEFTYDNKGNLISEEFYENGTYVLKNTFDSKFRPETISYPDEGYLKFDYSESETYITVNYKDNDKVGTSITLYLDEKGYLIYSMQSADTAIIGTTWTYDTEYRCIDTVVESAYDGGIFTEEYLITYNDNGVLDNIRYFVPDSENNPRISAHYSYSYDKSGKLIKKFETEYDNKNQEIARITTEYSDAKESTVTKTAIEDGKTTKKEITEYEYFINGNVKKAIISEYDGTNDFIGKKTADFEYDTKGRITKRITTSYLNESDIEYTFIEDHIYDEVGNKVKSAYVSYDGNGNFLKKEIDEFIYNESGNITEQNVYIYDTEDTIYTRTQTVYDYSLKGEIKNTVTTQYDKNGKIITTIEK